MATVPLHPALVHLPLGLAFVLPLVSVGLALSLWRGLVPVRVWVVTVVLQALLVAGGVLALRTGEQEENRVERIVSEAALKRHEEAAEAFVWGAAVVLAISTAGLVRPARALRVATAITVAGTVVVAGLAVRVGHAGGELVYARGAATAYAPDASSAAPARSRDRQKHHDHD